MNPPSVARPVFETWQLGALQLQIHPAAQCEGRACTLHNPSAHSMVTWPLLWHQDTLRMDRVCPIHGVSHPDPDDVAYRSIARKDPDTRHDCCGCCSN